MPQELAAGSPAARARWARPCSGPGGTFFCWDPWRWKKSLGNRWFLWMDIRNMNKPSASLRFMNLGSALKLGWLKWIPGDFLFRGSLRYPTWRIDRWDMPRRKGTYWGVEGTSCNLRNDPPRTKKNWYVKSKRCSAKPQNVVHCRRSWLMLIIRSAQPSLTIATQKPPASLWSSGLLEICGKRMQHMGVSINGSSPKWMVYNGKSY